MSRRVGTRRLGRRGVGPLRKRNAAAECGLSGRLPGGARDARAPAEEVRVTSQAGARPEQAGSLPTASQLPRRLLV